MTDSAAFENERPWRVGRRVGRTIYVQLGLHPSDDDLLIGVMDSPEIAASAVEGHNYQLALRGAPRPDQGHPWRPHATSKDRKEPCGECGTYKAFHA